VWCWGLNNNYVVDPALPGADSFPLPHEVPVGTSAHPVDVEVGWSVSCVLYDDGNVWCWGGTSRTGGSGTHGPSQVQLGTHTATDIATGSHFACAVLDDTTARCWGQSDNGALGYGSNASSAIPVVVTGVTGATAIDAGGASACVIVGGGAGRCWGGNNYAELGAGFATNAGEPTAVDVVGVSQPMLSKDFGDSYSTYSCALLQDHSAICWGGNLYFQLGTKVVVPTATPVVVGSGDHTIT
jgi:alpha-tubulin suppressor-like RCC1 family protein